MIIADKQLNAGKGKLHLKSRRKSGDGMKGMVGMQGIRVGMRGIRVGMRGMGVEMRGIRVRTMGIRAGMRGSRVEMRGKIEMNKAK